MAPTNTNTQEQKVQEEDYTKISGKFLASPPDGEEIVITGLSGHYPDSHDVYHFRDNLYNKVDLVSKDNRRWIPNHPEIPQRTGKMYNVSKFDAGFFGVHFQQAQEMDPMSRLILERVIEACFDAGINPSELEGTRTGVFIGACFSESEKSWFFDFCGNNTFSATGCTRSMISNRVSYFLKLNGPSFITDTACSSSLYALEHAYKALRTGQCDKAIVGGTNVCLHPFVSLQFARLGVLSLDGSCKSFDASGNGYARSEAICAIILEKAKDARRHYATILHAKTNCDGYKEQGITYPSGEMQRKLLQDFYEECNVDPTTLSFLEAHGTGTKVGDPEECNAIDEIFCKNRKIPLLIGSVKSNIGHTEPTSGLCSITKCIIGMEHGYIPPNINYSSPREGVKALLEGRLKVVTEKTPFQDNRGLLGVNSFGFGGGNCHVLLKWNPKQKINKGLPRDNVPRLVCISGRTVKAVEVLFKAIDQNGCDAEYIRLLHQVFSKNVDGHIYRGFTIMSKHGELYKKNTEKSNGKKGPLYIAFGDFGKNWKNIARDLMNVPLFAASLQRMHNILSNQNINITEIIIGNRDTTFNYLLGSICLQIAFVDIIKILEIHPDAIVGYSLGEFVCAYYDNVLTLEETLLCILVLAKRLEDSPDEISSYCIELDIGQLNQVLPDGVEVTAIVSQYCAIISGPSKTIDDFVNNLQESKIFTEKINTQLTNFHGVEFSNIKANLIKQLNLVIRKPRKFSKACLFYEENALGSAEYFISNCSKIISFKEILKAIDNNSNVLELGSGFFKNILEKHGERLQNLECFQMYENEFENGFLQFLKTIGSLYNTGHNFQIDRLYPRVQYPVSRGTQMISPSIRWDWTRDWFITKYNVGSGVKSGERNISINLKDENWTFITGHTIDGRVLFPATGYLQLVWETLAHIMGVLISDMKIVFENCKFLRATTIPPAPSSVDITVMVQRGSGNFEVIESQQAVVSGTIYVTDNFTNEQLDLPQPINSSNDEELFLSNKDIYKELRLRGYNYKGTFKGLHECDNEAIRGLIKWNGNWINFMDSMLQIKILQEDTRLLYVPTSIERLSIDAKKHITICKNLGEQPKIPVYVYKDIEIIKCGAIEIRGLKASSISRRRQLGEPVLEKYLFVPNVASLTIPQSLRVIVQLGLENAWGIRIKAIELIDESTPENSEPLGPMLHEILQDQPLVQPDVTVLSKTPVELKHVKVEDKKLISETDCSLVIGSNILRRLSILHQSFGAIRENNFILSREEQNLEINSLDLSLVDLFTVHRTNTETILFFRKKQEVKQCMTVDVSNASNSFNWLPQLQGAVKTDGNVIVYAQNDRLSGILGLVNCIRREPGGGNVRSVFIMDENVIKFDQHKDFYAKQLNIKMAVNVFKNGVWGTYRHLILEEGSEIMSEHCFVNVTHKGDLSSLRWIEGPLRYDSLLNPEQLLVQIYYAALNFRDVMTASGRLNVDVITRIRTEQECVQGFEFSGRLNNGRKVMGMVVHGALSTILAADKYLLWNVPEGWSLEDAATIPVVYGTVIYALVERGNIKRGEKILIHSGSGGIGQAAIRIALHMGCQVFTTVGTKEKREFLKKTFPQLTDRNIGNSRDVSFEDLIKWETRGKGVDIVLNSLAEEKLQASVRCLARGGRFLEIGKFDLAINNPLHLMFLEKEASFHGIMLDQLFTDVPYVKVRLGDQILRGIESGAVKPLTRTVFEKDDIEKAFRYMTGGRHMGKVLIKVRKEERSEKELDKSIRMFKGIPRFFCNADKCYIITGGLGGFGLELADWLVLRGARKLLLTSRTGLKNGYQSLRIKIWKSYGVIVKISTSDIKTKDGCVNVIKEAKELGEIESIFNLAVVLKDAILENQNAETFKIALGPKAIATMFMDEVTRKMCPTLRDFVIFSSVSCGRGNPGQSNYGMANSVMERICEKRREEGFPALAIEWGAIGEVGLVAEMQEDHIEMEIGGTLQQRIYSCLQVMDNLLRQNATIVSSMVVAEKRSGAGGADNVVDACANILGLRDLKTVSLHATLAELGMDSMTAVEIKQTLEREFDVYLTAQDIRSMTFARLQDIQADKEKESLTGVKREKALVGMDMLIRLMGDEENINIPKMKLESLVNDVRGAPKVLLFPGVEGVGTVLSALSKNLQAHTIAFQFCYNNQTDTLIDMAENIFPLVKMELQKSKPFTIIGYSFGAIIALEIVSMLENEGYHGQFISIDGAPAQLIEFTSMLDVESDAHFETSLVCHLMALHEPYEVVMKHKEPILKCNTLEDRIRRGQEVAGKNTPHTPEHQRMCTIAIYKRIKSLMSYKPTYKHIKASVRLFKPSQNSMHVLKEDYLLTETVGHPVEVSVFEGNHVTILENLKMAEIINGFIEWNDSQSVEDIEEGEKHFEGELREIGKVEIIGERGIKVVDKEGVKNI